MSAATLTASDSTAVAATPGVSQGDLAHAVMLRVQKEARHDEARRSYWSGMAERGLSDEERVERFNALRFAGEELRRARAHMEDLIHTAARGGVIE